MKTITVETSQLSGAALDWAVAKAVGLVAYTQPDGPVYRPDNGEEWTPSTDWSQGGPLIERYCGLTDCRDAEQIEPFYAETRCSNLDGYANGTTLLIAACRAIVAAELGDDVEVPAELVEANNA